MDKKKCPHGLDVDPQTGEHIFPKGVAGVDPNGYPIYTKNTAIPITEAAKLHQQELDGDKLLAEARSLIEYNKREKEKQQEPKQELKQTKWDKEIERSTKEWEQYFNQHPNKIRYNIFEEIEHAFDY